MSTVNCDAPAPTKENQNKDQSSSVGVASPKTIADLPPEVLTIILEFLTTDRDKKTMMGCREVASQWKEIMDSIIKTGINSGVLEAFPQMRIENVDDQLQVCCSSERFVDGVDPFPFNSVLLTRSIQFGPPSPNGPDHSLLQLLSLPAFALKFGGNLTTLSLHSITKISLTTFAAMLSSMPNLKRMNLMDIYFISVEEPVIPTAPLLPSLHSLKLVLSVMLTTQDNAAILLSWLIGSYAEQLVHLDLDSVVPPLPLHPGTNYIDWLPSGETRIIVTLSESAFRKLKELKISHPCKEFLLFSETPALQRFSVVVTISRPSNFDLEDLAVFMNKCSSTLEFFTFDSTRNEFVNEEAAGRLAFPRLKTFIMRYPYTDSQELILSVFLRKFTALTTLHLLHFRLHRFDRQAPVHLHQMNLLGNGDDQNAGEIKALKDQLVLLRQQKIGMVQNNVALIQDLQEDGLQVRVVNHQERKLNAEVRCRARIFNRLATLGENTKKVMVQQLLERVGAWDSCPNLKTVFVSSTERRDGDICVARRTDDA